MLSHRLRKLISTSILIPTLSITLITSLGTPIHATTQKKGATSLSVTPTKNLPSTEASVRVSGKGFNPSIGIYVALCVTPAKGSATAPGPCGGGVNLAGNNPASAWVSSNPPAYGKSLATPFTKGGKFRVRLTVSPNIGDIDCRVTSCSIVTRADHTRSFDRTSDLFVPVTFK
jgi:hypothetical protein